MDTPNALTRFLTGGGQGFTVYWTIDSVTKVLNGTTIEEETNVKSCSSHISRSFRFGRNIRPGADRQSGIHGEVRVHHSNLPVKIKINPSSRKKSCIFDENECRETVIACNAYSIVSRNIKSPGTV